MNSPCQQETRMKSIEPPDSHYLKAAEGWLELGDCCQAIEELKKISLKSRFHPLVLLTHWEIHATAKQWSFAHLIGQALMVLFPGEPMGWINASYSLHQMEQTREAWATLRPAANMFPKEPLVAYNLACYACRMGDLKEAARWLEKAMSLGNAQQIRQNALGDPDLRALWNVGVAPVRPVN